MSLFLYSSFFPFVFTVCCYSLLPCLAPSPFRTLPALFFLPLILLFSLFLSFASFLQIFLSSPSPPPHITALLPLKCCLLHFPSLSFLVYFPYSFLPYFISLSFSSLPPFPPRSFFVLLIPPFHIYFVSFSFPSLPPFPFLSFFPFSLSPPQTLS